MLLKQSGAAVAGCNGFSPSVVCGDQIEMSTVTELTLQPLIRTDPGLERLRIDLAATELQELSSSRLSQHRCAQTSNDTAVQRRAHEGAQRPTRPSACNGGLAGIAAISLRDSMRVASVRRIDPTCVENGLVIPQVREEAFSEFVRRVPQLR